MPPSFETPAFGGLLRMRFGVGGPCLVFAVTIRYDLTASEMENEGGRPMPFYLTRFSYTPATWAKLMKNPEDRREAAKQYIESVGGKLHGFWYAFGDHDGYNLW